jgi:hypothetical protein
MNYTFLRGFENALSFETNPLYAILQEAIYCERTASNWSAERIRTEHPEFDIKNDRPVFFTGEMIYRWMFDEYKILQPLKQTADLLTKYENWPQLYNKSILQTNTVPCAAAIYYNDMYVQRTLSEETAKNIHGIKLWITSEYEHNGLRADGEKVLSHLLDMLHKQTCQQENQRDRILLVTRPQNRKIIESTLFVHCPDKVHSTVSERNKTVSVIALLLFIMQENTNQSEVKHSTPLPCRLGIHKWKNYGEIVKIAWKEPGFVPSTTQKIEKYVYSERECLRCGMRLRRLFAPNRDGTQAAIGWEKTTNDTKSSS